MNLTPLNHTMSAKHHYGDKVSIIAADSMQSRILKQGKFWNLGTHVVNLYRREEKIAQLVLSPGDRIYLVSPHTGIIDIAIEPKPSSGQSRIEANSRSYEKAHRLGTMFGFGAQTCTLGESDNTLYGRHADGTPVTDREAAGKPAFIKTDRTVYTVPPHVGQNIEVPNGSVITTYDPKARGL